MTIFFKFDHGPHVNLDRGYDGADIVALLRSGNGTSSYWAVVGFKEQKVTRNAKWKSEVTFWAALVVWRYVKDHEPRRGFFPQRTQRTQRIWNHGWTLMGTDLEH